MNLLKEFNSPTAACFATAELAEDELTASPEEGEVILTISQCLSAMERKLVQKLSRYRKLLGQSRTKDAEIRLEIGDAYPISRPSCKLDHKKLKMMNDEMRLRNFWK